MARKPKAFGAGVSVAVIGLGRFGGQVAESLERLGHEVLAIDEKQSVVQRWSQRLTYVVQADATDETALQQIGLPEFAHVVVGIGSDVEASVLTVVALRDAGVKDIWATASSAKHAKILSAVGVRHVIYPEAAMGERIAHLIISKMLDFIQFDDDFAIAKTRVPASLAGRTLADSKLRARYGLTVVGVKRPGKPFEYGSHETVLPSDGVLIIAGTAEQLQRFSADT